MEEIIRRAKTSDIPRLKEIWEECFPKDKEYGKFFFEKIFKTSCAVVCEIEGECVAMIHVFPRELSTPSGMLSAKYIYGVGTLKKYRGRQIAKRLLESEAHSCDVLFLIPQSESLFEFYKRYGFSEICEVQRLCAGPKGTAELKAADEEDIPYLNRVYEKALEGAIYVRRNFENWKLLIEEHQALGGGFAVFNGGYCAYYEAEGKIIVSELFSEGISAGEIAGALRGDCEITMPGNGKALAVIKPISGKARRILSENLVKYINLMHN